MSFRRAKWLLSHILRAPSGTYFGDTAFSDHPPEDSLYGRSADIGKDPAYISFGYRRQRIKDCRLHASLFGNPPIADHSESFVQLPVTCI